ncbi:MAG: hypothetical protein WC382_12005 [Methanoregulaceae archaeon]
MSATVDRGSSTNFQIVMDRAPAGISGYYLRISLANPAVAEITGVSYPSWVTFKETVGVPSDVVTIAGTDIDEQVQDGATDILLASVTLLGDSEGTSGILLQVNKLDADGGDAIEADTTGATVTVNPSSGNGGSSATVTSTTSPTSSPTTATTTAAPGATPQLPASPAETATTAVVTTTTILPAGTVDPGVSRETPAATVTTAVPTTAVGAVLPIPLALIVATMVILAGSRRR